MALCILSSDDTVWSEVLKVKHGLMGLRIMYIMYTYTGREDKQETEAEERDGVYSDGH